MAPGQYMYLAKNKKVNPWCLSGCFALGAGIPKVSEIQFRGQDYKGPLNHCMTTLESWISLNATHRGSGFKVELKILQLSKPHRQPPQMQESTRCSLFQKVTSHVYRGWQKCWWTGSTLESSLHIQRMCLWILEKSLCFFRMLSSTVCANYGLPTNGLSMVCNPGIHVNQNWMNVEYNRGLEYVQLRIRLIFLNNICNLDS